MVHTLLACGTVKKLGDPGTREILFVQSLVSFVASFPHGRDMRQPVLQGLVAYIGLAYIGRKQDDKAMYVWN